MPFVSRVVQGDRTANPTCQDKGQPKLLYLDSPFSRTGSTQRQEPTVALPSACDANATFKRKIRGPDQLIAGPNPKGQKKGSVFNEYDAGGANSTAGLYGLDTKLSISLNRFSGGPSCSKLAAVAPCSGSFAQGADLPSNRSRRLPDCWEGCTFVLKTWELDRDCEILALCSLISESPAISNANQYSSFAYLQWK